MAQDGRARQQRAVLTRTAVLEGAAREFDERGYVGASMDGVADRAGVTKGALYFHFASKADLAAAVIAEQHAISRRYGAEALAKASSPLEAMMWMSQGLATQMVSEVAVSAGIRLSTEAATSEVARSDPYTDWMAVTADLMRQGIAAGQVDERWDPELLGRVIIPAYTGVQTVSDVLADRSDLFERLRDLWTVLLAAIVTDAVRPEIPRLVGIIAPAGAP
ncbi:TetR family transcriptional regulator [Curtobacterium sp. PhB130]|uniref:ScbR family autoregulator-binding transcription factor n=1 Tax=unclassified Curtobacterium TaxID=257496 RepID=UPI000F4BCF4F|nr:MULTISPECIES: ScbR family autoregulator-binding transcription factor [unclassified Curtobacterium]ROP63415.1 TetR family transcriptional regulator [Curtobacterium sp. ZW137]ROS77680.1 TetR family transcriptional regulator [Curtobacterium sp. PhB130]TCK66112.1 TetR family transcriptional regulator [Curtobacterium sp. PhB136]